MKERFEKLRLLVSGFGGMLFIATLGLSILIFGGILTNARQTQDLRASIEADERALEKQRELQPVAAEIRARQRQIRDLPVPRNSGRPVETDEIPGLRRALAEMADAAGLTFVSARPSLEDTESDFSLRMEVRLRGEFEGLRPFLENLLEWEYAARIKGFSLRSVEAVQEMQLVLKMEAS